MPVVRGVTQTVDFEVWDDDARIAPSSGTFYLRDDADALVSSSSVTVRSDGTVHATVLSTQVPATLSYSDGWRVVWELTISGEAHTYDQPAALVRNRFLAPVVGGDLVTRHPEFGEGRELHPKAEHAGASYGDWIREAESWVEGKLWTMGRRPWLILDVWQLRETVLFKTLAIAFRWASTFAENPGNLTALAERYEQDAEDEFGQVQFRYDAAGDGQPSGAKKIAAVTSYILSSKRPNRGGRGPGIY